MLFRSQSALYLAETSTGLFGVYTMGPGQNGNGVVIRRHDITKFRAQVGAAGPGGNTPPANPNIPQMQP